MYEVIHQTCRFWIAKIENLYFVWGSVECFVIEQVDSNKSSLLLKSLCDISHEWYYSKMRFLV